MCAPLDVWHRPCSTLRSFGAVGTIEGKKDSGKAVVPDAGNLERATRVASSEVEGELRRVLPKEQFLRMEVG